MRIERHLISVVALFLALLLIAGGVCLLFFPEIQLNYRAVGTVALGCGALLLCFFYLTFRRRYYLVKMGGAAIHDSLLAHYAREVLQEVFPHRELDCDVIVHKKSIEILANIPYLSDERLKSVETLLAATLLKYCGYKGQFIFNVSFS